MKKIFILLCLLVILVNKLNAQKGSVNFSLGFSKVVSSQFSAFSPGGNISPGLEYWFNPYFSLSCMGQWGFNKYENHYTNTISELFVEDNSTAIQINNSEFILGLSPKIYTNNLSGKWNFYCAPALLFYRVQSDISEILSVQNGSRITTKQRVLGLYQSTNNFSFGFSAGAQLRNANNKTFTIELGWQNIDYGKSMNGINDLLDADSMNFATSQILAKISIQWYNGFTFLEDFINLVVSGIVDDEDDLYL
jgi:hypothetical protein